MVASFPHEGLSSHGGTQEAAFLAFQVENRVVVYSLNKIMLHSIYMVAKKHKGALLELTE